LRLAAGESLLHRADRLRVESVEEAARLRPRLLGGVAGDDVQTDAEAQGAALLRGQAADPGNLLRDGGGRFAPGEVDVDVLRRDAAGDGRGAAEVHLRHRVGYPGQPGARHPQVV